MAQYYQYDKKFEYGHPYTRDEDNLNHARFFYKRAVAQIKQNPSYPEGSYEDTAYHERQSISVQVFKGLSLINYLMYTTALINIINKNIGYSDTLQTLMLIRESSEECLNIPQYSQIWDNFNDYKVSQVVCQARKEFANTVLEEGIEQKRLEAEEQCHAKGLKMQDCPEHKQIIEQLITLNQRVNEAIDSI